MLCIASCPPAPSASHQGMPAFSYTGKDAAQHRSLLLPLHLFYFYGREKWRHNVTAASAYKERALSN